MTAEDKILFGQVAEELKSAILDEALYAKAFSEADGDINYAKARYIKLRVHELREIRSKELKRQQEENKEKQRREAHDVLQREDEARRREAVQRSAEWRRQEEELAKHSAARSKRYSQCRSCGFVGIMKYSFIPPKGHVFGATALKCSKCGY